MVMIFGVSTTFGITQDAITSMEAHYNLHATKNRYIEKRYPKKRGEAWNLLMVQKPTEKEVDGVGSTMVDKAETIKSS